MKTNKSFVPVLVLMAVFGILIVGGIIYKSNATEKPADNKTRSQDKEIQKNINGIGQNEEQEEDKDSFTTYYSGDHLIVSNPKWAVRDLSQKTNLKKELIISWRPPEDDSWVKGYEYGFNWGGGFPGKYTEKPSINLGKPSPSCQTVTIHVRAVTEDRIPKGPSRALALEGPGASIDECNPTL